MSNSAVLYLLLHLALLASTWKGIQSNARHDVAHIYFYMLLGKRGGDGEVRLGHAGKGGGLGGGVTMLH